jgi:hypothetical protein
MSKGTEGKKPGLPPYQFLAIYEIVSIKRVAGDVTTTRPHSETKKRPRGSGAGAESGGGSNDSEESEDEEWQP